MPTRRCLDCRRLFAGRSTRCPECQQPGTRTGYDSAERRRRRDTVAVHVEAYGPVCPGWGGDPMHVVSPAQLTADHLVPVAAGGHPHGPLGVLCRSHNSRKAARTTWPVGASPASPPT